MASRLIVLMVLVAVSVQSGLAGAAEPMYPKLAWDVGIRDVYLPRMKLPDTWAASEAIGVQRLEVVVDKDLACPGLYEGDKKPYRIDTPENREKVVQAFKQRGMAISCFCAVIRGKDGPDPGQVDWVVRIAEAAGEMKVPVIMLPLGYRAKSDAAYVAKSIAFLNELVPVAKRTGVQITIENLGHYLNREEIVVPIMEGVPTDQVGLANDITNMYWFGHPVDKLYDLAEAVAPYVRYVHVKSVKYPADKKCVQRKPGWQYGKYAEPVRTGDVDFSKVIGIYAAAGFKGDLTIEDDSLGKFDPDGVRKVLVDDVKLLREIIKQIAK